jgi:non-homologous end joining protein Ku
VVRAEAPEDGKVVDLMEALRKSLGGGARSKAPLKKAGAAKAQPGRRPPPA